MSGLTAKNGQNQMTVWSTHEKLASFFSSYFDLIIATERGGEYIGPFFSDPEVVSDVWYML